MRFDLDKIGKVKIAIILGSFLVFIGFILGRGDWRVIFNPIMIFFYLLFGVKAIVNKEYYEIKENVLYIFKGKECKELNIKDIMQICIIHNYIIGRVRGSGHIRNTYLISDEEKILVSLWYKNEKGENIIEHLEKYYGIKVKKEVNISTTEK